MLKNQLKELNKRQKLLEVGLLSDRGQGLLVCVCVYLCAHACFGQDQVHSERSLKTCYCIQKPVCGPVQIYFYNKMTND